MENGNKPVAVKHESSPLAFVGEGTARVMAQREEELLLFRHRVEVLTRQGNELLAAVRVTGVTGLLEMLTTCQMASNLLAANQNLPDGARGRVDAEVARILEANAAVMAELRAKLLLAAQGLAVPRAEVAPRPSSRPMLHGAAHGAPMPGLIDRCCRWLDRVLDVSPAQSFSLDQPESDPRDEVWRILMSGGRR